MDGRPQTSIEAGMRTTVAKAHLARIAETPNLTAPSFRWLFSDKRSESLIAARA